MTADWRSGGNRLRATFGHGMPFVYFERKGGARGDQGVALPQGRRQARKATMASRCEVDVVRGRRRDGLSRGRPPLRVLRAHERDLDAQGRHVSARRSTARTTSRWPCCPTASPRRSKLFREHAYAFVTETRVSWSYDEKKARAHHALRARRRRSRTPGKGLSATPLLALYRHQWLHTTTKLPAVRVREPARRHEGLATATRSRRSMSFGGVLPVMPVVGGRRQGAARKVRARGRVGVRSFPLGLQPKPDRDTYWTGKSLGRVSTVMQLADAIGDKKDRDFLLRASRTSCRTGSTAQAPKLFYYDKTWATIVGRARRATTRTPRSTTTTSTTATSCRPRQPSRATTPPGPRRWAPFVELLAKDAANPNRDEHALPFPALHGRVRRPRLGERPRAVPRRQQRGVVVGGHELLDGPHPVGRAVGQQGACATPGSSSTRTRSRPSSSTGSTPTAPSSPRASTSRASAWCGARAASTTRGWTTNPIMVHGINYLPFQGGSLYLGRRPELVAREYDALMKRSARRGLHVARLRAHVPRVGRRTARSREFDKDTYLEPEFGDSRAMTYNWINTLSKLGRVDATVTADVPTYAVFSAKGKRSYVAYNPEGSARKVTFSDGFAMEVAAHAMARGARAGQPKSVE